MSGTSAPAAASTRTAPRTTSRTCRWISRSEGMAQPRSKNTVSHGVGKRGFGQDDIKRRDVVVPLDQCRLVPKALKCAGIERPHRLGDPAAMGVDQDFAAPLGLRREAAQMQLRDGVSRELGQIAIAIEAEIMRAEIDVADVAEEPAAGALDELGQE